MAEAEPIDEVTRDAIGVMRTVGQGFAATQKDRWWSNEWKADEAQQRERIEHWSRIRDRIGELCDQLKARNV